eukprot:scaffold3136_cov17-Tisochrysis_lutea.AAC.2
MKGCKQHEGRICLFICECSYPCMVSLSPRQDTFLSRHAYHLLLTQAQPSPQRTLLPGDPVFVGRAQKTPIPCSPAYCIHVLHIDRKPRGLAWSYLGRAQSVSLEGGHQHPGQQNEYEEAHVCQIP